jgi:hypothetical protein
LTVKSWTEVADDAAAAIPERAARFPVRLDGAAAAAAAAAGGGDRAISELKEEQRVVGSWRAVAWNRRNECD